MIRTRPIPLTLPITVQIEQANRPTTRLPAWRAFVQSVEGLPLSQRPEWLTILHESFGHDVYMVEATTDGQTFGLLPLVHVKTRLFGRFLVSLPYLNSNGVMSASSDAQQQILDTAAKLADDLGVRYLELRQEEAIEHPRLTVSMTSKVHMRMQLPTTTDELWKQFDSKVRNQIRKGDKHELSIEWGGVSMLESFYDVISRNMRDLGTPVYGRNLFRNILQTFPTHAEICVVRQKGKSIAAALLLHGDGVTEVPTASSLREYNPTCCNMWMYRHLLDRAVNRKQRVFDFGRSTVDGATFKFKKQWGAEPQPACWQYYVRRGSVGEMRPDNPRYRRMIRIWQRIPLQVTQWIGPAIVRGIP